MNQNKGLKRNTIDKYYTKTTIVDQCIDIIKDKVLKKTVLYKTRIKLKHPN